MKRAVFGRFGKLDYAGNEALNTICTNLYFAGRDVRKVAFTSCSPGDGKSYVVMQVARNLARRGKRVVVVDADMRRSYLISKYRIQTEGEWLGLAHYLAGYNSIDEVLYETNLKNLYFLPIGREVANPMRMLDSELFGQLLDALAEAADIVLVDCPPIGVVVDAAVVAKACDGVVMVVRYNQTRRRELRDALKQMQQTLCPVLGVVINKVTFDSLSEKKYYNRTYYSHYSDAYYHKDAQEAQED